MYANKYFDCVVWAQISNLREHGQTLEICGFFLIYFPTQKPIVLVNALTFGYRPDSILLEQIDLRVDINSRIGVVGANGCGKSTLIKLIMGQLSPLVCKHACLMMFNVHVQLSINNQYYILFFRMVGLRSTAVRALHAFRSIMSTNLIWKWHL